MNESAVIIATVVVAHFLALISPGPDFLLVIRSALRNNRRRAVGVALGIALANGIYIVLCMVGVGAAIAHSIWLMFLLKIMGGIFFALCGIRRIARQTQRLRLYHANTAERSAKSSAVFLGGVFPRHSLGSVQSEKYCLLFKPVFRSTDPANQHGAYRCLGCMDGVVGFRMGCDDYIRALAKQSAPRLRQSCFLCG